MRGMMGEEECNVDSRGKELIMSRNIARVGPPHHQWLVIIGEPSFFLQLIFFYPSDTGALI